MDSSLMKDFCHRKIALAPSNPCWALAFLGPEQGAECSLPFSQAQQTARDLFSPGKTEKKQIPRRMASRNDTAVVKGEWNDTGYSAAWENRHKN
ncbi:MAG: hypothetical protein WBE21_10410 [Candidatus Acidiferrales bacterium]